VLFATCALHYLGVLRTTFPYTGGFSESNWGTVFRSVYVPDLSTTPSRARHVVLCSLAGRYSVGGRPPDHRVGGRNWVVSVFPATHIGGRSCNSLARRGTLLGLIGSVRSATCCHAHWSGFLRAFTRTEWRTVRPRGTLSILLFVAGLFPLFSPYFVRSPSPAQASSWFLVTVCATSTPLGPTDCAVG